MFNESLFLNKTKRAKRLTWLTLPFSLLLHVLVIGGLVVVPLLRAEASLPQVKVIRVLITAPAMPLPPSKGPGGKKNEATKSPEGKNTPDAKETHKQPVMNGVLIAPIAIPETIKDEDYSNIGVGNGGSGGGGGIIDGVEEGGDPNALQGLEDCEKSDGTQPVLRIASVQMPRKIREVKPVYSQIALDARIQGRVVVEAMTDIYGRVRSARIISSASPLLNESALIAIKQWLYEPFTVNGIPKPVLFTVTITFALKR